MRFAKAVAAHRLKATGLNPIPFVGRAIVGTKRGTRVTVVDPLGLHHQRKNIQNMDFVYGQNSNLSIVSPDPLAAHTTPQVPQNETPPMPRKSVRQSHHSKEGSSCLSVLQQGKFNYESSCINSENSKKENRRRNPGMGSSRKGQLSFPPKSTRGRG